MRTSTSRPLLPGLLLVWALPVLAGQVARIHETGPDGNRLVVVLTGDGYTDAQQAQFDRDAADTLALFLTASPWKEYAEYLNVYTDFVPSAESGADRLDPCWRPERLVDTAFDAHYCHRGIRRLLVVSAGKVFSEVNQAVPTWDVIGVIVNDPLYGGSGGGVLVFSTDPDAMGEIFLHEAGHTFAGLADEYESDLPGAPMVAPEPNVTMETEFDRIDWNPWIEPGTPLPTPETVTWEEALGLFEGARYYSTGIFRPRQSCKMRTLRVPFGEVCREAHIQTLYTYVSPIDGESPAEGQLDFDSCARLRFEVTPLRPLPQTLAAEWRLNGAPIPAEDRFDLVLDGRDLTEPAYVLEAVVSDMTPMVRRLFLDPMQDTRAWNLVRTDPSDDLDGDGVGDACDDDIDGDTRLNEDDCWPRDPARTGEPVPEVPGLMARRTPAGEILLSWTDVLGPRGTADEGEYLLTSGGLEDLARGGGFDDACGMAGSRDPSFQDTRPGPGSSAGRYYLVQGSNGCGPGEIGDSSPPPPDPRDSLVWALLPACP